MAVAPGDGLLRPTVLAAIAICAVNDHLLKTWLPSWWTGKLSDVAGLIFFPVLLQALVELGEAITGRWRGPRRLTLCVCVVITATVFAAINVSAGAAAAYVGLASEARSAIAALWGGGPVVVKVTSDAGDLLALPALLVALVIGWRRTGGRRTGSGAGRLAVRPGGDLAGEGVEVVETGMGRGVNHRGVDAAVASCNHVAKSDCALQRGCGRGGEHTLRFEATERVGE